MRTRFDRRTLISAAGAAAAAAVFARPGAANAAEWTEPEKANVKIVTDFCAAWLTHDSNTVNAFLADGSARWVPLENTYELMFQAGWIKYRLKLPLY